MKDDVLLDEDDIVVKEEAVVRSRVLMMLMFRLFSIYFLFFCMVGFWLHRPCNYDNYFSTMSFWFDIC